MNSFGVDVVQLGMPLNDEAEQRAQCLRAQREGMERHWVRALVGPARYRLNRMLARPVGKLEVVRLADVLPDAAVGRQAQRGQRIRVGTGHAGATLTVEAARTTFRVHDGDQLPTEVARTTTKDIARFKVRKPEPARRTPR